MVYKHQAKRDCHIERSRDASIRLTSSVNCPKHSQDASIELTSPANYHIEPQCHLERSREAYIRLKRHKKKSDCLIERSRDAFD